MSFTACGIHIFAGSFTLGIMQAGFDIKAVYENLGLGLKTAQTNFSFPIIYPKENWSKTVFKDVHLVYSNPPCSAFSRMGKNIGSDDPINDCMYECAEQGQLLNPDIFIMESVPGLYDLGKDIIRDLQEYFPEYQTTFLFSDSVLHGSPQIRPRFHLIFSRYDFKISAILDSFSTVKDAIWDLRLIESIPEINHEPYHLSGQIASLAEYIPPGITAGDIWRMLPEKRDNEYGQPFGPSRRLSWNSPGPTITGGPTLLHPDYNRFITIREEARMFGYPDDFIFYGNRANQYAQIGKAVTVFMGNFLGNSSRITLQKEEPFSEKEKIIDLLPYSRQARDMQKLDWFGGLGQGSKIERLRKFYGKIN